MSEIAWRKSSFSGDRDECVEVGRRHGEIVIRESDAPDVVIAASGTRIRGLLEGLKAGHFD